MRLISLILLSISLFANTFDEDYLKLPISQQKKEFKKILLPLIKNANRKILQERAIVIQIFKQPFFLQNPRNLYILATLARKYHVNDLYNKQEFLKRIDTIPPNLILAQGAIESAWGRSYFVQKANNIFGQWTYNNKGLIPRNRDKNKTHTIRIFRSLEESLEVYMRNLNRNPAYKEFRDLRYQYKEHNKTFSAFIAATTLHRYSQLGQEYVRRLQKLIKQFQY
ncbi:MAG: mannosyl-glycoprotein endo-beta-N-acetylglucosamidase [Epsilonproteobacteria bacterium]|nr:mannosyl-glycoprotein endo-beta-N-acetylglucosamidase [Campylobacterota bacterium]